MVKIRLRRMGAKKAPFYRIGGCGAGPGLGQDRRSAHRDRPRAAEKGRRSVSGAGA